MSPPEGGPPMGDPATALGLRPDSDGYDQPRRWSQPWSRGPATALTAVAALLVGFLLTAGLTAGRNVAQVQDSRRAELIELIRGRQEHVDAQAAQLDELRGRLAEVEAETALRAPALQEELGRVEAAVGAVAVRGPGMRVTLGDAAGTCPTGREEDCRIQDTDVQLIVNALFGAGAEAIAVNGERLIATSAIRSAGQSILVNYRVLASPYVVEALGDPDRLAEELPAASVAQEFEIWSEVYGLGFVVEEVDEVELPAYGGAVRLRSVDVDDVLAGGGG
jgi:uncharacterized protein YlxW (UPF0749 family)